MLNRAYGLLEVKSVDEDARVIEGIASTIETDRQGDIVEARGAQFSLPLPLLWMHRSDQPVGHVVEAKVLKDHIWVRAKFAKIDDVGELKNFLDRAWHSVKAQLVRGLSIGFRSLEHGDIDGTWGIHFKVWEWLELSLVTIPANPGAGIQTIKSVSRDTLAALGHTDEFTFPSSEGSGNGDGVPSAARMYNRAVASATNRVGKAFVAAPTRSLPGASGVSITPKPPKRTNVKTTAEQITDLETTRAAKLAALTGIQSKAAESGKTKDAAEREEFDTLSDEIEAIDTELKDLRALEKLMESAAKPVDSSPSTEKAAHSRDPRSSSVVVEREEKLEKGIAFARFMMCVAAAKGNMGDALSLAQTHYPRMKQLQDVIGLHSRTGISIEKHLQTRMLLQKAAVPAATTGDSAWAGALVAYNTYAGDFLEYLRPRTILGQFGTNGIPDVRRIPFNVHIKGQTVGGTGYWVGEGAPKPVTKFGFNDTYHSWHKVAAIAVLTEEMIRFSDPSAERLSRDALASALIERIDTDFVDPTVGATAVRPAAITNTAAAIASSGDDADAVREDIQSLWAPAMAANLPMQGAVYITTPSIAMALALMTNALGQPEFPNLTMNGGTLLGVPVIVSNYVDAGTLILAFAPEIYLSDDGQVTIDASREASIQMLDNPTNDATGATVATAMVSMYQTDSVALRAHRFINWSLRRSQAVRYLTAVSWGGAVS